MRRTAGLAGAIALLATSVTLIAGDPAQATAACGTHVTYSPWVNSAGKSARDWTWTYRNCDRPTTHWKVIVNNGPDSSCFTTASGQTHSFGATEIDSLVGHYNIYQETDAC